MNSIRQIFCVAVFAVLAGCGDGSPSAGSSVGGVPTQAATTTTTTTTTTTVPTTADLSKQIGLTDAIAILKLIVGLSINTDGSAAAPDQLLAADFDQNGAIELTDAIGVLKLIVGLNTSTPVVKMYNVDALATNFVTNATTSNTLTPSAWVGNAAATASGARVLSIVTGDVDSTWSSDATYNSVAKKADLIAAVTTATTPRNGTTTTVPGAPTISAAEAGDSLISLSYAAPSYGGSSAITSYTATCNNVATVLSGNSSASASVITSSSGVIVISNLTNGFTYTCTVKASNLSGDSLVSIASDPATPTTNSAIDTNNSSIAVTTVTSVM